MNIYKRTAALPDSHGHTHRHMSGVWWVLALGHWVGGTWKCPLLDDIRIALLSLCHFSASEEKEDFLLGLESPSSENRHSVCAVFLGSFMES